MRTSVIGVPARGQALAGALSRSAPRGPTGGRLPGAAGDALHSAHVQDRGSAQELRARRARREPHAWRAARTVPGLVRPGAEVGAARAQRHDGGDGGRERATLDAGRADQGVRRARHRLVHELREPQGSRARCPSGGRAAVPLGRTRARRAHRRNGRARRCGRVRRLLRLAPAGLPNRRLGFRAESPAVFAGGAGGAGRRVRAEVRPASAAAAALGRFPARPRLLGVLAGASVEAARPHRLPPRRRRRLDPAATGALTRRWADRARSARDRRVSAGATPATRAAPPAAARTDRACAPAPRPSRAAPARRRSASRSRAARRRATASRAAPAGSHRAARARAGCRPDGRAGAASFRAWRETSAASGARIRRDRRPRCGWPAPPVPGAWPSTVAARRPGPR